MEPDIDPMMGPLVKMAMARLGYVRTVAEARYGGEVLGAAGIVCGVSVGEVDQWLDAGGEYAVGSEETRRIVGAYERANDVYVGEV